MGQHFSHDEAFPVIRRLIIEISKSTNDFVTHSELVHSFAQDAEGSRLLQVVVEGDKENRPREWWASNMIQWFSQRYTVTEKDGDGSSESVQEFLRRNDKDGYAYKPRTRS